MRNIFENSLKILLVIILLLAVHLISLGIYYEITTNNELNEIKKEKLKLENQIMEHRIRELNKESES